MNTQGEDGITPGAGGHLSSPATRSAARGTLAGALEGSNDNDAEDEEGFPNFRWKQPEGESYTFFRPTRPTHIVGYSRNKNNSMTPYWAWGVELLEAMIWYYGQIRWTFDPKEDEEPTITWVELYLDFLAATHCPITRRGSVAHSGTKWGGEETMRYAANSFMMATTHLERLTRTKAVPGGVRGDDGKRGRLYKKRR